MPTALEQYFQAKQSSKPVSPILKLRAAKEFTGEDLMKHSSPGFFTQLLDILDRPGNATRALLVGKLGGLKGLIPFAQLIENLTGVDIALNKEDRVAGTEVIESWFGKQKQRPGKIDSVDALGLLVEVVADPLWFVGGAGALTKAGKAKTLVSSALKSAVGNADEIAKMTRAITAAKQGTIIAPDVVKPLAKALHTVYSTGLTPRMGKTWAQQAARGERALLSVLGKPVIKGEKIMGLASKVSTKIKTGPIGKAFLPAGRRVSEQYSDKLNDIITHFSRDLPDKQKSELLQKLFNIRKQVEQIAEKGDVEKIDNLIAPYIESLYAGEKVGPVLENIQKAIGKKYGPKMVRPMSEFAKYSKRLSAQEENLVKAGIKKEIPKPELVQIPKKSEIPYIPEIKTGPVLTTEVVPRKAIPSIIQKSKIKGYKDALANHPVYQTYAEAVKEQRQFLQLPDKINFGDLTTEAVQATEGRPWLRKLVDRSGKRTSTGRPSGIPFDEYVDELKMRIGKEGDDASGLSGVSDFFDYIDDIVHPRKGKLSDYAIQKGLQTNDPEFLDLYNRYKMAVEGSSEAEIEKVSKAFEEGITGVKGAEIPKYVVFKNPAIVPTAQRYENAIAKLKTNIENLKQSGGSSSVVEGLQKKIASYQNDLFIERLRRANKAKTIKYERAVAREGARVGRNQAKLKGLIGELERKKEQAGGGFKSLMQKAREAYATKKTTFLEKAAKHEAGAKEIIEQIPEANRPAFGQIASELHELDVARLPAEKVARLPVDEIDRVIGYYFRSLTPEAAAFLNEKNLTSSFSRDVRAFSARAGFQKKRGLLGDMFRSEVDDYFKSIGFEGIVFEPSALKSSYLRGAKSAQKIGVSNTIMESVKRLSKTEKGLQLTGENINDWMPVNALMDKVGLKYLPEEFAGKYLQKDVFKALNEMYSVSSSEEVMSGLWKAFTDTQRFMKSAYTVFFPAHHGRNALSNFFLNWIAGVKDPKAYYQAFQLQKAATATRRIMKASGVDFATAARQVKWPSIGGKSGEALWDLADQYGIVGRALGTMDVAEVAGTGAQKLLHPGQKGIRGAFAKGFYGQDPVSSAGRAVGRTVEDNARLAHFVKKLSEGYSPMDAARSVKEVLFDYGSLSAFEKKYLRDRMFFFYCVPETYEILTKDGWKKYSNLSIGETVLGYDVNKNECEWTTVSDIAVFDYHGELMSLSKPSSGAEWLFTPNHRWPVRCTQQSDKSRTKIVRGYNLRTSHAVPYSAPFNDWPKESILTPREAAIIGWLITDGTMTGYKGRNWRIYQHPKKFANEIRKLLGIDSLKESVHPDSKTISFGIGKELRNSLTLKGFTKKADAIKFITKLNKEAAIAMWDAMYKADGTMVSHRSQDSFACMQDNVFDVAQILTQLFGKHMHRATKGGYISKGQWCKIGKLGVKWYEGKVWCPQTGTGTWVMRNEKKKIIITGNTFARKNIELQTKTLMQQPAKQAFFAHLAGGTPRLQGEGKYRTDYQQEILNMPTPFKTKEGLPYEIQGLGSPIEEAFGPLGAPGVGVGNRISRLASRAVSRLSPLINTPYELAFQKNLFLNTPITNYPEWAIQKTPVGRAYWTGKQIAGGYRQSKLPAELLNLSTGIRVRAVDVEKMKEYKLRQVARKVLEQDRRIRPFTRYYAPDKTNLPDRLQSILQMQK